MLALRLPLPTFLLSLSLSLLLYAPISIRTLRSNSSSKMAAFSPSYLFPHEAKIKGISNIDEEYKI